MGNIIHGQISSHGDGMAYAAKSMATQMAVMKVHTDNIAHFGIPGYQKKEAVVRSFAEYLGPEALEVVTNADIGRIRYSGQPLDLALQTQGYFQRTNMASGQVEITRDGRMKLDQEGNLLSLDNQHILSVSGQPIQFPYIPLNLEKEVDISATGEITLFNPRTGKVTDVAKLAVVSPNGDIASDVDVKQGYVEDSNVFLQQEFTAIMPLRRQFNASRQVFIVQSDALSRMIQELGRAQ